MISHMAVFTITQHENITALQSSASSLKDEEAFAQTPAYLTKHPVQIQGNQQVISENFAMKPIPILLHRDTDEISSGVKEERHRHRYEVNPELTHCFEKKGLKFVGRDTEGNRMEVIELEKHPYFVEVQFHPEFSSRPMRPSPPYLGLLLAATGTLNAYLQHGCKLSPSDSYSDLSNDSYPEKEFSNPGTS
ncbi:hypothetical protein BTVI_30722 [Pitangus sulphuratus]|nr:hypothetical protein BTVI_30722 [Pitangus sulphuratus]